MVSKGQKYLPLFEWVYLMSSFCVHSTSSFSSFVWLNFVDFIGTPGDALYKELWHACAGPLVTLPREGERVYYFPQGHMEQVCPSFKFIYR